MFKGALASRDYRRFLLGNIFTLNGVWIERIVLGWLAWDLTNSVAWTGAIGFLLFGPTMVGAPFFGVLADRMDLRKAMMAAQSLQLLWASALTAMLILDVLTIWRLAAVGLMIGVTASAYHPARMALAPLLAPKAFLPQVVALGAVNFNICRMTGPAIGGLLITHFNVETAAAVSAIGFLPVIVALSLARPRDRYEGGKEAERRAFLTALADGARHAKERRSVTLAFAITLSSAVTGRAATELLPAIADGLFLRGASGLGQMTAAVGAGAIVATVMLAGLRDAQQRLPLMTPIAAFASCTLTAALGNSPEWLLALALVAALGFFASMVGVGSQTIVQLSVEEGYRGRVMSLWTVVGFGGAALGALGLGALADLIGIGAAYAVFGAVSALGLSIALLRDRRRS